MTTAPFRTVHTTHSDRPGDSRTLESASGYEIHGMTSGYGDFLVHIRKPEGGTAARIEWVSSRGDLVKAWGIRRPHFPEDVHLAMCDLFPFLVACPCCGETGYDDPYDCSFCDDQGHDHSWDHDPDLLLRDHRGLHPSDPG